MSKIKMYLTYIILATFPIMSFINITSTSKFNLALSDIFIILLGIIWLIDIKNFRLKSHYPYWWYFGALIIVFLVSNIYNLNSEVVSSGVSGIVSEGIKFVISALYLFVGYNAYEDKASLKNVLRAWIIGLWVFIIYGLYAHLCTLNNIYFWSFNNNFGHGRFLGTITDANAAGTYLTFSFFIILLYIYITDSKKGKWFGYITEPWVIICLILTQSRGSWIGFAFGFGLFLLFNIKRFYKLLIFAIPIGIILLFSFINIDYSANNAISEMFVNRVEEAVEGEGQFIIRTGLTKMSISMGLDNPIIGVGRGNFVLNSGPYADNVYDKEGDFIYSEIRRVIPHTTFIGMFAELGILGFISFSSIFILLFYKMYKSPKYINSIIIFTLCSFFVQSLTLNLENFRGLWIFIGIALFTQDNKFDITINAKELEIKTLYKPLIIVTGISLIIYLYTARIIPEYITLDNGNIYNSTILVENHSNTIELVYYIKGSGNVQVYDNENNLIIDKGYSNVDGFVKTELENTNKYNIIFTGEKEFIIKNLYYSSDNKTYSLSGYKYTPDFIEKIFNGTKAFAYDSYQIKNSENPKYPLDFGDYTILDSRVSNLDGYSEIEFDIRLNNEIKNDDILNVTYSNDDISNMPNRTNKMINKYSIKQLTKDISLGQQTTFKINFKGENVNYNINANIKNRNFYVGEIKPNSLSLAKYLNSLDENKLILLAIMDEGTSALNYNTIYEFKKFKFNLDLIGKSRYSYLAVGSKNDMIGSYEGLEDKLIEKQFVKGDTLGEYELPFDATIKSAGFTNGNIASIVINGVEYSKMRRGMNIVVYDINSNQVIDSVNFDTHISVYK